MANNYGLGEVYSIDKDIILEVNTLNVIGKKYSSLNVAYSKKVPVSFIPENGIQEIILNLELEKLRELDDDDEKHTKFIKQRTFDLDSKRINLFILRLLSVLSIFEI